MSTMVDIAIIGAGPYGLSIASHLRGRGVDFRIFGSPMQTWRTQMPKGMRLKSEGFASALYDPESELTLGHYCKQQGIPYADIGFPIPLETFISYGQEFQKRFVPNLEDKTVVSLDRTSSGFQISLADGEALAARRVVVAVGISHFQYVPQPFPPYRKTSHLIRRDTSRLKGFAGARWWCSALERRPWMWLPCCIRAGLQFSWWPESL